MVHFVAENLLQLSFLIFTNYFLFTNYWNLYSQLSANCRESEAYKPLMAAVKSLGTMVGLEKMCSLYDLG